MTTPGVPLALFVKEVMRRRKYPDELDEDLIAMIEDLIERRRQKRYEEKNSQL